MKKFNLLAILALVAMFAVTSCKDGGSTAGGTEASGDSTAVAATPADPNSPVTASPDGAATAAPATPAGPLTSIKFDEETHDWGTVMDGEKVTHVFKFKNTGNEPLVISNAKGSCGCTVPEWPRDAIAPGKSGEIKVVYDSKGKGAPGGKDDTKRVTINANIEGGEAYLTIKGKVDGKAK